MEGKRYSLRSRGSTTNPRHGAELQTKLEFPCRRRNSCAAGKRKIREQLQQLSTKERRRAVADENESPPKRSRVTGCGPVALKVHLTPPPPPPPSPLTTPTKSPLKETNQVVADRGESHVTGLPRSPDLSPRTPCVENFKTPQRVRKQLQFSHTATLSTPTTPATNSSDSVISLTPLQKTKRSLHNSLPTSLLCREDQQKEVRQWMEERLRQREGGSLYISGAPGTGKTACVTHLLSSDIKSSLSGVRLLTVNCMSVTTPQALYSHLLTQLQLDTGAGRGKKKELARERLRRYFTSSKKLILMVLDEMDQLDCRNQEVLYSLFEWSSLPHSRLILIGIANALDLTDRLLPRLTSHAHCKPHLLHFPPYTREEIATILRARVGGGKKVEDGGGREGGREVMVDPAAIEFCARKVSSVHGDLRKALDICRRAIELVESQTNKTTTNNPPPPSTPSSTTTTPPVVLHVKLPHIASVISSIYSSSGTASLSHSTPHSLPLQQKLAVATLLLCVRGKTVKEVSLGRLQDVYGRVCGQWQVTLGGGVAEFVGLCQVLESRGLLSIKKAKEIRLTKVTLKLEESEVERVLGDQPLLSAVLKQQTV